MMCLFSARRSNSSQEDGKIMAKARRRMPTFNSRNKHGAHALKSIVDVTTMLSPTKGGFHRRPTIRISDHGDTTAVINRTSPNTTLQFLSEPMRLHLRHLYDDLRGRSSSLSKDKFAKFLERTQGETGFELEWDRYKFEEFLEVWSYHFHWDAQRRVNGEKDLSRPISNYFISSSHNTYLLGNQLSSEASAEAYRRVLKQNCRCIEIDVWNSPPRSGSRTPRARSRSPHPGHNRHLSSSSVASTLREAFENFEPIKNFRSAKHSRTPSSSQPALLPEESRSSLDPKALHDRLATRRSRSRSGGASSSRSASISSAARRARDEPIVMHAHHILNNDMSLGTYVGFREVCKAVRETAFINTDLPLIVSLEVHADYEQQEVMVDIMKEEWGTLLLDREIEGCDPRLRLPTLEDLFKKILIKVKKTPDRTVAPKGTANALGMNLAAFEQGEAAAAAAAAAGGDDSKAAAVTPGQSTVPLKKVRICEKLSALAIYTHSEHFNKGSFFEDRGARTPSHIFSLDETSISELHATRRRELLRHNRAFLMRAYPNANRHWDSSNPDPASCWRKGVQMVALNWQNLDEAMMLNSAMFAGQEGWVLKPEGYRADATGDAAPPRRTLDLRITVIAGERIELPSLKRPSSHAAAVATTGVGVSGAPGYASFKPSVKCILHVEKAEKAEERSGSEEAVKYKDAVLRHKTPPRETDHPDWGAAGATLAFESVKGIMEELSFVRFRVEDENASYYQDLRKKLNEALGRNDNLAGWACIRLDRLQQGYRFVRLMDAHGRPTEGKLLIKVEKTLKKP